MNIGDRNQSYPFRILGMIIRRDLHAFGTRYPASTASGFRAGDDADLTAPVPMARIGSVKSILPFSFRVITYQ
jgi:hypothetical protein